MLRGVKRDAREPGYFYEKKMRKNIGKVDRIIRSLVVAVLVWLLVTHQITNSRALFFGWVVVAVLAITALDETSPLYLLLGISTRRKANDNSGL